MAAAGQLVRTIADEENGSVFHGVFRDRPRELSAKWPGGPWLNRLNCDNSESYESSCECLLEDGLAEAGGALEVGGYHRLQLLHHAQPPLHLRHDARLFGQRGKHNWNTAQVWTRDPRLTGSCSRT